MSGPGRIPPTSPTLKTVYAQGHAHSKRALTHVPSLELEPGPLPELEVAERDRRGVIAGKLLGDVLCATGVS